MKYELLEKSFIIGYILLLCTPRTLGFFFFKGLQCLSLVTRRVFTEVLARTRPLVVHSIMRYLRFPRFPRSVSSTRSAPRGMSASLHTLHLFASSIRTVRGGSSVCSGTLFDGVLLAILVPRGILASSTTRRIPHDLFITKKIEF